MEHSRLSRAVTALLCPSVPWNSGSMAESSVSDKHTQNGMEFIEVDRRERLQGCMRTIQDVLVACRSSRILGILFSPLWYQA